MITTIKMINENNNEISYFMDALITETCLVSGLSYLVKTENIETVIINLNLETYNLYIHKFNKFDYIIKSKHSNINIKEKYRDSYVLKNTDFGDSCITELKTYCSNEDLKICMKCTSDNKQNLLNSGCTHSCIYAYCTQTLASYPTCKCFEALTSYCDNEDLKKCMKCTSDNKQTLLNSGCTHSCMYDYCNT